MRGYAPLGLDGLGQAQESQHELTGGSRPCGAAQGRVPASLLPNAAPRLTQAGSFGRLAGGWARPIVAHGGLPAQAPWWLQPLAMPLAGSLDINLWGRNLTDEEYFTSSPVILQPAGAERS